MMFIDADVTFEPADALRLFACAEPFVCGLDPVMYAAASGPFHADDRPA